MIRTRPFNGQAPAWLLHSPLLIRNSWMALCEYMAFWVCAERVSFSDLCVQFWMAKYGVATGAAHTKTMFVMRVADVVRDAGMLSLRQVQANSIGRWGYGEAKQAGGRSVIAGMWDVGCALPVFRCADDQMIRWNRACLTVRPTKAADW